MGWRQNSRASRFFVCLGLHMFHYPSYVNLPGHTVPQSVLPKTLSERTGMVRNPLISTKHTSKTPVIVCNQKYTHGRNLNWSTICLNRDQASDSGILTPGQGVACSPFFLIWANSLHFPAID